MSDFVEGQPEFATAMRGYDRVQVDEYVARLHALVAEAEEHARMAETKLESGAHAAVGPRVTQIFDLAIAESAELRARVQAQTDELLTDARQRAEERVAAGEREAERIIGEARAQGEAALAELEGERQRVREQVAALEARKSHLVEQLRGLQAALGSAAESVDLDAEPPSWDAEGKTQTMEQQPTGPPGSDPGGTDAHR